jgi:hypothetical protein
MNGWANGIHPGSSLGRPRTARQAYGMAGLGALGQGAVLVRLGNARRGCNGLGGWQPLGPRTPAPHARNG